MASLKHVRTVKIMKLIVKGKSEKSPFRVVIPQEELVEVLCYAMEKSNAEHEEENATSPGGFPTALFTCIFPAKARDENDWDLKDGWNKDKAIATFDSRLERKQGGGGFSLETRQKTWDEKAAELKSYGVPEAGILKALGKRPEAKKESVQQGMDDLRAAGIV